MMMEAASHLFCEVGVLKIPRQLGASTVRFLRSIINSTMGSTREKPIVRLPLKQDKCT
ncbi:hypothetical protein BDV30DRAFT_210009 [Aspergillus minisclerotigenes]|uniref:Uncharacterized protein n=1 Tax=Aspergillus minisclerotigenes TaxID=656917 RepID=A0A5N6J4D4_9EURO|nr:hypothetical protein BDV30DRAFT_210009 [Aspergillus minisclerotigenes]